MQSIDLSVDFADWSEAGLEVKNTFLHACSPYQRKSVKSDSICNYTLYRQTENDSKSLLTPDAESLTAESESESPSSANAENVTAGKLKNKRPGKKARARIQKRSNRHDTLASIASVSTEASSDQDMPSPRSEHEQLIQPAMISSGGLSGLALAQGDYTSTPPHGESVCSQALVVDSMTPHSTFIELPSSTSTCIANEALMMAQAEEIGMAQQVAPEVKQSLQAEAENSESDVLPRRSGNVERVALVASSFFFGVLFVTALVGLLWGMGVVQIQVAHSTMEHCHKNELKAFKEDIEARLAFHERRLQDVAETTETMPSQQLPDAPQDIVARPESKARRIKEAADASEKMPIRQEPVSSGWSSPTNRNNVVRGRAARPARTAPEYDFSPSGPSLKESVKPIGNSHEQDVAVLDGPTNGWLGARSLCCVWLSLVFLCSMAQIRVPWMMNKGFGNISIPVRKERQDQQFLFAETGSETVGH